jgi:hypothetical protein
MAFYDECLTACRRLDYLPYNRLEETLQPELFAAPLARYRKTDGSSPSLISFEGILDHDPNGSS